MTILDTRGLRVTAGKVPRGHVIMGKSFKFFEPELPYL